jgi:SMC interacting uncharacterized protein involved in chromosome segregation
VIKDAMSEKLGITRIDAKEEFDRLSQETTGLEKEVQRLQKEVQELKKQVETVKDEAGKKELISRVKEFGKNLERAENRLRHTKENLIFTRDGYSVYVLESLEDETRKLGGLTTQLDSDVKALHAASLASSGVLEYLTRILIAVTIVIIIQPLILQLVGPFGLPVVAVGFIVITVFLTRYFRKEDEVSKS